MKSAIRAGLTSLCIVIALVFVTCTNPLNSEDEGGGSGSESDPETYTVSYEANGATSGTAPDEQTKTEGIDLTLATNTGSLARTGYTFAGWNTAADGSGDDYAEGAIYTTDANLALYAKWTANQYTVSYDANGATSGTAPDEQTKNEGVDLTLATNSGNLARTGYTFAGWNTAADGSGDDYAEGAIYATDADLTLYAKWAANQYSVTLNRQGGSGGAGSVIATFDAPMPSATAPSKAGVVFDGYYTGLDGTGRQYYTATMESARDWDMPTNTELIANWRPYEVGETGPAGGIVFYDKGAYSDGWRYLEAAPASTEWESKPWGGYGTEVGDGAQGKAVGTGAANTQAIVAEYGNNEPDEGRSDYAAKLCDDLDYDGFDDWFLPSRDELDLMYQNLHLEGLGGFASAIYWSSSEYDANFAWVQSFVDGVQLDYFKDRGGGRVRAARAF
jgi:uncharacterized repeat protein (TIGR02543 family)